MKSLVIGQGQIGSALYDVIKDHHESFIRDMDYLDVQGLEVMHICFPDSVNFVDYVEDYIHTYRPKLTIIHSSIGIGKTRVLGKRIVYSPMRGRHPKLSTQMKVFPKYVSAYDERDAEIASSYLKTCGFNVVISKSPHTLELVKLLSNIHMGLECAWAQEVERIVEHFEGDHEIYKEWEKSYSEGYKQVGDDHLIRPLMDAKPIGGHCIVECTDILSKQFHSQAFDFIRSSNEKCKREKEVLV